MATCTYEGETYECSLAEKYVLPAFEALDATALAGGVKSAVAVVPWAGAFHLIGIAMLGAVIFAVDMRALGYGITSRGTAQLRREVRPLLALGLLVTVASGVTLALGELMKIYYSPLYWVKMAGLAGLLFFVPTLHARAMRGERVGAVAALVGALGVAIWVGALIATASPLAWGALALLAMALAGLAGYGRRKQRRANMPLPSRAAVAVGMLSMGMWLSTATAGRWIAFY